MEWRKRIVCAALSAAVMFGAFSMIMPQVCEVGITAQAASLSVGSRGSDVTAVQKRLIELGYLTGNADGVFGPKTQTAVKSFQQKAGLVVDGLVGTKTKSALMASNAPKANSGSSQPVSTTTGKVNADLLNVRSGPGSSYSKVTTITKGTTVTILSLTSDSWYQIRLSSGTQGYVSKQYIISDSGSSQGASAINKTGVVTADVLNVRKSASSSSAKVTTVTYGTKVTVISSSNGWYQIKLANGTVGYVSSKYIKISETTPTTTTTKATTTKTTAVAVNKTGVVTGDVLNVRKSSSSSAAKITTVTYGTKVTVISSSNGWYQIKLSNGTTGYVSASYIKISETTTTTTKATTTVAVNKTGVVTGDVLNVRKSPSTSAAKVTTVIYGTKVTVISSSNGWYQIKLSNGTTGYVSSKYIEVSDTMAVTTPSTTTPAATTPKTSATTSLPDDPNKTKIGTVRADALNIRKSASTSAAVVTQVTNNATVTILETLDGWYKVQTARGSVGYCSSAYIVNVRYSDAVEISFKDSYLTINKGASTTYKISQNVSGVTYTTTNTDTATVDNNGLVKGINYGLATITATSPAGQKASYIIIVQNPNKNDVTAATNKLVPSDKLIKFISEYEGGASSDGKFYVYKDVTGISTIGYGHVVQYGESFPNGLTKEQAEDLLKKDLTDGSYAKSVRDFAIREGVKLNQNQFDALLSFTYNLGPAYWGKNYSMFYLRGALIAYRDGSLIPKGDIIEGFGRYHLAGGQKYSGLYYRRVDEAEMFYAGDYVKDASKKFNLPAGSWK